MQHTVHSTVDGGNPAPVTAHSCSRETLSPPRPPNQCCFRGAFRWCRIMSIQLLFLQQRCNPSMLNGGREGCSHPGLRVVHDSFHPPYDPWKRFWSWAAPARSSQHFWWEAQHASDRKSACRNQAPSLGATICGVLRWRKSLTPLSGVTRDHVASVLPRKSSLASRDCKGKIIFFRVAIKVSIPPSLMRVSAPRSWAAK